MCNTVECLSECATNKPTIHHITDELWVAEHNKGNSTHYCMFDSNKDESILSLVTEGEECPCMDKILTDPRSEHNLGGPAMFISYLQTICDEMEMVKKFNIESFNHGMACNRCTQLKITEEH